VDDTEFEHLTHRPRRLRRSAGIRRLVQENRLFAADLVLPVFVREGLKQPQPISSMPGVVQHSPESFVNVVEEALANGVGGLMIFGVPVERDENGDSACDPQNVLAQSIRTAKAIVGENLPIIADLCLDEFTTHGHCGVLDTHGNVDNDLTLTIYQKMAIMLAEAGADILGLSGMMDGQVGAVRRALDEVGHRDVALLAYTAKYASAFYGPFRDAVDSQLKGDRLTYQQNPANVIESLRQAHLDAAQGADIVMVKPGLPYLDDLHQVSKSVPVPVATYIVSGEYSMIEFAAQAGAIDRIPAIFEALTSAKRAGANIIVCYWAMEIATILSAEKR